MADRQVRANAIDSGVACGESRFDIGCQEAVVKGAKMSRCRSTEYEEENVSMSRR